jgi:hypothetical protein
MRSATLAIVTLLTATGCSAYSLATPKVPPIPAFGPVARTDVATVCVVRPSHFALLVTFVVHDNGELVGATRGESYFCYFAQPGRHEIVSTTGDSVDEDGRVGLVAQAGRRYWLHQDYDNDLGSITPRLLWIDEQRALDFVENEGCEYRTLTRVPAEEKAPPGPAPVAAAR